MTSLAAPKRHPRLLHRIADSPWLNIFAGAILLISGMLEMADTMAVAVLGTPLGAEHGLAVFGALQMLKALPDALKGLKFVEEGEDVRAALRR